MTGMSLSWLSFVLEWVIFCGKMTASYGVEYKNFICVFMSVLHSTRWPRCANQKEQYNAHWIKEKKCGQNCLILYILLYLIAACFFFFFTVYYYDSLLAAFQVRCSFLKECRRLQFRVIGGFNVLCVMRVNPLWCVCVCRVCIRDQIQEMQRGEIEKRVRAAVIDGLNYIFVSFDNSSTVSGVVSPLTYCWVYKCWFGFLYWLF